jgi:hypothetical protein
VYHAGSGGRTPFVAPDLGREDAEMRIGWALALVALLGSSAAAAPPQPVTAVLTGGSAILIKCYSWFVSDQCNTYHHIRVPEHIAVGDTLRITYGSNPKNYGFPARRIKLHGDRCRIYGERQGGGIDKLIVTACRAAPQ